MGRFDTANDLHCLIVGAHYQLRMQGPNPAGVDAAALLEALATAVPVATDLDIIAALRAEGQRLLNEAEVMARYIENEHERGKDYAR